MTLMFCFPSLTISYICCLISCLGFELLFLLGVGQLRSWLGLGKAGFCLDDPSSQCKENVGFCEAVSPSLGKPFWTCPQHL